jgi:hypothetical protein
VSPRRRLLSFVFFPSLVVVTAMALTAPEAGAQPSGAAPPWEGPISVATVDLRGSLAKFPSEPNASEPRGIAANTLADFGWGGEGSVHVYPLRGRRVALGLGASLLWTSRTATPDAPEGSTEVLPGATTKLRVVAAHVSANFGDRDGWSYLSGGVGRASLSIAEADAPDEESGGLTTWHAGGGARWFWREHLGFTFDVRFYRLPATAASLTYAGNPAFTSVVGSVGVSIR